MRRFYASAESFSGTSIRLEKDETRHLRDVLRMTVGDELSVFDGEGREYTCTLREIAKTFSVVDIIAESAPASPESPFKITVAATVMGGEKYDLIIQKAVELGVVRLVPVHTIRSEVKIRDAEKRVERWRRIALEATKQTGRAKLMQIGEPATFAEVIKRTETETVVLFSERDGAPFDTIAAAGKITIIFGPKGGWDEAELDAAKKHGATIVTLGGRILRAETASIAITAILQHRFGDLK